MGVLPRPRGHVLSQVPPEAGWLPRSCPELPARHGSSHVGNQSFEEGMNPMVTYKISVLTLWPGPRFDNPDDHLPPDSDPSPRHYTLSGALYTAGPAS